MVESSARSRHPLSLAFAAVFVPVFPLDLATDIAEDRGRFSDMLKELGIPYPNYGTAYTTDEAIEVAKEVGYPVLVRPSYVLGGQRMRIVINDEELEKGVII